MSRISLPILSALVLLATAAPAQTVQLLGRDFDFAAKEVFFPAPMTYLNTQKQRREARVALKITIRGRDFSEGSLGPRFYLGNVHEDAHEISPDGQTVVVYFYGPRKVPSRTWLRMELKPGVSARFRRLFELSSVRWLSPQVRERHKLPKFLIAD